MVACNFSGALLGIAMYNMISVLYIWTFKSKVLDVRGRRGGGEKREEKKGWVDVNDAHM